MSTSAARYQQLSLNPQKLAGQCGKLKCCLNYELDSYLDALKDFPKTSLWLHTQKGTAVFQKMDIFKGWIWYAYKDNPVMWHKLTVDQTNQIIQMNKKNQKVGSLEEFALEHEYETVESSSSFTDVVGQDSLTRFDKPKNRRRRKKKPRGKRNRPSKPSNKK